MTPRLSLPPVLERCGDLRAFGESSARGADRNRSVPSDLCLRGTWGPFPAHGMLATTFGQVDLRERPFPARGHARGAPECLLTVEGALSGLCTPPHQSSRDGPWERAFSTWACSSEPPGLQQARINHRDCNGRGAAGWCKKCRARPGRVTALHRTPSQLTKIVTPSRASVTTTQEHLAREHPSA